MLYWWIPIVLYTPHISMKRGNVFPCRLCFTLVFHISLHFLISLVRQESRLISPHLASSSCCWILPLSSGISFCSTWKLPRYMLTFWVLFLFFFTVWRILGFYQMPNHCWCFYLIISLQLLINILSTCWFCFISCSPEEWIWWKSCLSSSSSVFLLSAEWVDNSSPTYQDFFFFLHSHF